MKNTDRYVEAARVECDGLDHDALIRRIAALSRRLDSETARAADLRRYARRLESREEQ